MINVMRKAGCARGRSRPRSWRAASLWVAAAAVAYTGIGSALAQEPDEEPEVLGTVGATVGQAVLFDDNIRLLPDSPGWVFGSTTSARIRGEATTPLVTLGANLGAAYNAFTGPGADDDLDSLDWLAGVSLDREFLRANLGARAEYRRQAARESEIEETGETRDDADRVTKTASVNGDYELSPIDRLDATAGIRDVSFSGGQATRRRNPFSAIDATGRWTRMLTPRDTGAVVFRATFFDADDLANTKAQAYILGPYYERAQSPRLTLWAGAGGGVVVQERDVSPGVRDETTSPALELQAGATYVLARTSFEVGLFQEIQASARGSLEQVRSARVGVGYLTSETTELNLSALYATRRADIELSPVSGADRTYVAVEPMFAWEFLEDWRLQTGYRFRYDDDFDGSANSHAVFAAVTYGFAILP